MKVLRFCAALLPVCLFAQPSSALNMSRDLVAKGIASANLQPDSPALDARPIFEAAVAYAGANGIATLIADPGSYYFLSLHSPNQHVLLNAAANLTVDWQNSDLYFEKSNVSAIQLTNCAAVTIQNFTLDYLELPFTQVTVTSVDAANRNLGFETMPVYQAPSDFNAPRTPPSYSDDSIWVFLFRGGAPLAGIGRLGADLPVSGNTIHLTNTKDPWAQQANLAGIQPGDIAVFTDRGGPPAINIVGGQSCTIHNASIYSSGQIGLYFGSSGNGTADHVQVIPRPGTDRLVSTNADGIHYSFALANNTVSNSIVRRTCDDAIAIASSWIATVSDPGNGASVVVNRAFMLPFAVGDSISFIDSNTAAVLGTAKIQAETPPAAQQTGTAGEAITLTLDQAIAGLAKGSGVIYADAAKRGGGSIIRNNTVQEGVFSRGIWLSGVENVRVTDNLIEKTSNTGIFVQQLSGSLTDTGPSAGITIQNNMVDSAIMYGAVSAGPIVAAGSIHVVSENSRNAQVATMPNSNIVITGNRIANSPRSAIRVENVNGGQITGNAIQGYGLAPSMNLYNIPFCCESMAQYLSDFTSPVLATASAGLTQSGNITGGTLVSSTSAASANPRMAAGSIASAYGQNLAPGIMFGKPPLPVTLGGTTVTVTDSAGVARQAPLFFVSPGQVNYLIPAGTAPGNATVTIGSSAGGAQIDTIAPGLFSANSNGRGVAAAGAAIYPASGSPRPLNVAQCQPAPVGCTAVPMDLGEATDQLILTLYGTGLRGLSSLQNATVTIGGARAKILYAGPQPEFTGLDQINVVVPRTLAGAGEVPVVVTLDGQTANAVTISVK